MRLKSVSLKQVVQASLFAFKNRSDMKFNVDLEPDLVVLADEVELGRVISNLVENARRYGKSPDGVTVVDIMARSRESWVLIKVRDYGAGVAPDVLPNLTKPFFRGDSARTAATGAGLGLAIVAKTIRRMGGRFGLTNSSTTGLVARIQLQLASRSS